MLRKYFKTSILIIIALVFFSGATVANKEFSAVPANAAIVSGAPSLSTEKKSGHLNHHGAWYGIAFANQDREIEGVHTAVQQRPTQLAKAPEPLTLFVGVSAIIIGLSLITLLLMRLRSARKSQKAVESVNKKLELNNDELNTTIKVLEEANQAKVDFLATMSSEIRTPLNAIIGLSDVMLTDVTVASRDKELLKTINKAGSGLLHTINDILDVSQLETGELVVTASPVEVERCVLKVTEKWRIAAMEKNLQYLIDIDDDMGVFETDGRLLNRIVSILISNAIKFTNVGEIRISLRNLRNSDGFEISVRDTGTGIAAKKQKQIFDAFKQANSRLKRSFGGMGVGLAICKKLTMALGGEISLESVLGQGSQFTVRIPAPSSTIRRIEVPTNTNLLIGSNFGTEIDLSKVRVLIAEDNQTNIAVMKAFLNGVVGDLTVAKDGKQAVEVVKNGHVDIVLMDKQMPVMDGLEATKAIRALAVPNVDTPIIGVTADSFDGAREHFFQCGIDGFLSKPVTAPALIGALKDALAKKMNNGAHDAQYYPV